MFIYLFIITIPFKLQYGLLTIAIKYLKVYKDYVENLCMQLYNSKDESNYCIKLLDLDYNTQSKWKSNNSCINKHSVLLAGVLHGTYLFLKVYNS